MREVVLAPSHQGLLESHLHDIFPQYDTITNARKPASLINPATGWYFEVDSWLPEIKLCFEFQDEYHFKPAWYSHIPLSKVKKKDDTKRHLLLERGLTLIIVPYWWDGTSASLQRSIFFHRPDLGVVRNTGGEITINPPSFYFAGQRQLMLASFPDDTYVIEVMENKPWWVGEKWDGIRCFWNPAEKQLYSRHNLEIFLNPAVNDIFGTLILDGELWCGRGFYLETQHFAISWYGKLQHSFLRLLCFDEASNEVHGQPFEDRYALVLSHVSLENPAVIVAPRFLCAGESLLLATLQLILHGGGEGLILRKPLSRYMPGRSKSLLKIKASHSDQEALVVKVGLDGSLSLQLPNGFQFEVAKSDSMLTHQARRGDVVTFSFDYTSRNQPDLSIKDLIFGVPANPIVQRVRDDLTWEDVTLNATAPIRFLGNEQYHKFFKTNLQRQLGKPHSPEQKSKPPNYNSELASHMREISLQKNPWTIQINRRRFLDIFAESKFMDPLNPVFWYNVKSSDLLKHKGYKQISTYYGGKGLSKVLMHLYPDINLQRSKFKVAKKEQNWQQESSRKAYFEGFAASKGMDSLNPIFWYDVTPQALKRYNMGFKAISQYYGGTYVATVMAIYPNIGLQKFLFTTQSWARESSRREFLDQFAEYRGMDPLNPVFWYSVRVQELMRFKIGFKHILSYYDGSTATCLLRLYPNIGLSRLLLTGSKSPPQRWHELRARKSFFDDFATASGMDSLNPIFWYTVTTQQLRNYSGASNSILSRYHDKLSNALLQLYPNIGLQQSKFKTQHYWQDKSNRRKLFCDIAKQNDFDPLVPDNWYRVYGQSLFNITGVNSVMRRYYKGGIANALLDVFPEIGLQSAEFKKGGSVMLQHHSIFLEQVPVRFRFTHDVAGWASFMFGRKKYPHTPELRITQRLFNKYNTAADAIEAFFPWMTNDIYKYPVLYSKCNILKHKRKRAL